LINPNNPNAFIIASHESRPNILNLNETSSANTHINRIQRFEHLLLNTNTWYKQDIATHTLLTQDNSKDRQFSLSCLSRNKKLLFTTENC
jgi:hypothetical protein